MTEGLERRTSRRSVLAGALGAAAAAAAGAITRPAGADAANGDVVHVGDFNLQGSIVTHITSNSDAAIHGTSTLANGTGLVGDSTNGLLGIGVKGLSAGGAGVRGESTGLGVGVVGESWWGVRAVGEAVGLQAETADGSAVRATATNTGTGVQATAGSGSAVEGTSQGGSGVDGHSSSWIGVAGTSSTYIGVAGNGPTGVYGLTTSGYAFRGSGRVRFDKISGIATIKAGTTAVTLAPGVNVTADSFVLLTPMSNIGSRSVWFTKDTSANKITIRLSSSRPSATRVGWLLMR